MDAARALRMWPRVLTPLVHWFLPQLQKLRCERTFARRIIDDEQVRRRALRKKRDKHGLPREKAADSLGWMEELARGQRLDFTGGQLGLTFAAIHTTSDLLSKCLVLLATRPQLMDEIRAEMVGVLSREGWKKTSQYNMGLLDSFMN